MSTDRPSKLNPPGGLAGLPQLRPQRDAWPSITRRLQVPGIGRSRRLDTQWLRLAAAAALIVALGAIILLAQRVDEQDQQLQAWIEYSQELETNLRQLEDRSSAIRGHQAMAVDKIEDRLAAVDWQLAHGQPGDQRRMRLWQQRTVLLNDLVTIRAGQLLLPSDQQQRPVVTLNTPESLVAYEL